MNVSEWTKYLLSLDYRELRIVCKALVDVEELILDAIVEDYWCVTEIAQTIYSKAEYAASLEDEKRHVCTCGGDCKSSPEILCFTCKKTTFLPVVPGDSHPDGNSWLFAHASECGEIVRGRLYTKCDKYEPREESGE